MCIPWQVRGVGTQAHPKGAQVKWKLTRPPRAGCRSYQEIEAQEHPVPISHTLAWYRWGTAADNERTVLAGMEVSQ